MSADWTHVRLEQGTKALLDHLIIQIGQTFKTGRDPGYFVAGKINVNSVLTYLIQREVAALNRRNGSRPQVSSPATGEPDPKVQARDTQPADVDTSDAALDNLGRDMDDAANAAHDD